MVWDHIPSEEAQMMLGVFAMEDARSKAAEKAQEKDPDPPPMMQEGLWSQDFEKEAEEEADRPLNSYDIWGYAINGNIP